MSALLTFLLGLTGALLPGAPPPIEAALMSVDAEITSSLSASLAAKPNGSILAALAGRLFMWRVDLRREIDRGDQVRLVYFQDARGELVIAAARYQSMRKGTWFDAYRFQASGDASASYWDAEGVEVPARLREGPLRSYDQITALLKDRPTHQGMDFKAPVGTPVYVHRAGTINRVNWKRRGNGTCLEIRFHDGTLAKYLHLSQVTARQGQPVRPGQQVALTGNTGRSTAPHLHYQLQRGRRTVDPLDYHGTFRRTLPSEDQAALTEIVSRLQPRLELSYAR